jgi:hypothetical protein
VKEKMTMTATISANTTKLPSLILKSAFLQIEGRSVQVFSLLFPESFSQALAIRVALGRDCCCDAEGWGLCQFPGIPGFLSFRAREHKASKPKKVAN